MSHWVAFAGITVALLSGSALVSSVGAQQQAPGEVMISIFRVAPGKHLEFLRWQAEQAATAKEAGGAPSQWYAHQDGDSWDYISIEPLEADPQREAALDEKIESLNKQKGRPTGFAAGLKFREFIAFHTDTRAAGPMTVEELVGRASTP